MGVTKIKDYFIEEEAEEGQEPDLLLLKEISVPGCIIQIVADNNTGNQEIRWHIDFKDPETITFSGQEVPIPGKDDMQRKPVEALSNAVKAMRKIQGRDPHALFLQASYIKIIDDKIQPDERQVAGSQLPDIYVHAAISERILSAWRQLPDEASINLMQKSDQEIIDLAAAKSLQRAGYGLNDQLSRSGHLCFSDASGTKDHTLGADNIDALSKALQLMEEIAEEIEEEELQSNGSPLKLFPAPFGAIEIIFNAATRQEEIDFAFYLNESTAIAYGPGKEVFLCDGQEIRSDLDLSAALSRAAIPLTKSQLRNPDAIMIKLAPILLKQQSADLSEAPIPSHHFDDIVIHPSLSEKIEYAWESIHDEGALSLTYMTEDEIVHYAAAKALFMAGFALDETPTLSKSIKFKHLGTGPILHADAAPKRPPAPEKQAVTHATSLRLH